MVAPIDHVLLRNSHVSDWLAIRELRGIDEQSMTSTGTTTVIVLIDALLVETPGSRFKHGDAAKLSADDRDLVLASVYQQSFGSSVHSVILCSNCDERFDTDFELADLLERLQKTVDESTVKAVSDGVFETEAGVRFRLPTGYEECSLIGKSGTSGLRWLLRRCIERGDPEHVGDAVQAAMEEVAPIASLNIEARCPECRQVQEAHFDLQHFLLTALMSERQDLANEVHLIARTYSWSRTEIMEMSRSQRKTAVDLITGSVSLGRGS
jgi:hypothetical protein